MSDASREKGEFERFGRTLGVGHLRVGKSILSMWGRGSYVLFVVVVASDAPMLPDNFDARKMWPECESVISHARDQSACGACWAFAAVSAFNDRVCISSRGAYTGLLSVAYLASCCDIWKFYPAFGCSGGHPKTAWKFLVSHGIPDEPCFPYPFPTCDHTLDPQIGNSCQKISGSISTPLCPSRCVSESRIGNFFRAKNFRQVRGIDAIKAEILAHGPVSAVLEIVHDFRLYSSGVFSPTYFLKSKISDHPAFRKKGTFSHAVKIFGWGIETDASGRSIRQYWLIGNSWNSSWGEAGTGKMQMRTFGIEDEVFAADFDLATLPVSPSDL